MLLFNVLSVAGLEDVANLTDGLCLVVVFIRHVSEKPKLEFHPCVMLSHSLVAVDLIVFLI